ncbi:nickel transport system permease protein [Orbus hercynius]|uniref:Nickel transport system permease protein n=1 Tax=Orbus hercynius TaxID=593135 RepID=A0A495RJC1_9GAMM|nr:nickel/cobalt ABC transporter permease [Orbus hercynius]RKS87431.1 nickel transport system permease protein [Orbus hercynius]
MRRYIIYRLLMMIPLMLIISFIAFVLLNLIPSDPAEVALRVGKIVPTSDAITLVRHELGLDQPFFIRYLTWLWQILHLDFGQSFSLRTPVLDEIMHALPATLYLSLVTLLISSFVAFSLALLCVINKKGWIDQLLRSVIFLFIALPDYWLALLLIWLFAVQFDLLPVSGMREAKSVILPAVTLSLGYIGIYLRLIRGAMLTELQQPYVFYAKARGLSQWQIIRKHVLRNAFHTSLISLGMSIPTLIAGTAVIENVFAWPGIGRLCINAIFSRDYPMIQAYILLIALLFLVFNFVIDILQMKLDPRLKRH